MVFINQIGFERLKNEYDTTIDEGLVFFVLIYTMLTIPILFVVSCISILFLDLIFGYVISIWTISMILLVSYIASCTLAMIFGVLVVYLPNNNLREINMLFNVRNKFHLVMKLASIVCSVGPPLTFPQNMARALVFFGRMFGTCMLVCFLVFGHSIQRSLATSLSVSVGFLFVDFIVMVSVLINKRGGVRVRFNKYFTVFRQEPLKA